jgi:hypothetical protein
MGKVNLDRFDRGLKELVKQMMDRSAKHNTSPRTVIVLAILVAAFLVVVWLV